MTLLTVPSAYWDDYSERNAVDEPDQMASEVKRSGNRVTIEANVVQLHYLRSDAAFYAEGNTDDAPAAVLRGAKRVVAICSELSCQARAYSKDNR